MIADELSEWSDAPLVQKPANLQVVIAVLLTRSQEVMMAELRRVVANRSFSPDRLMQAGKVIH